MKIEMAILYREELKEYDFGTGHPFRGERYELFSRFLAEKLPARDHYGGVQAKWATEEDLARICTREYVAFTREYYRAANLGMHPNGEFSRFHSADNRPLGRPGKLEEAARLVVGQAKEACDLLLSGRFRKAVSVGGGLHHAKRDFGEGFCLYNDVAFAGKYLLEEYALQRILILDTDAHAGNGTAEYFYEDPRVLFIDLHQDPHTLYPGTGFVHEIGVAAGKGYTVNLAMPAGAGDACHEAVLEEIVLPLAFEFKPQIIIRNGGSDPHFADRLTHLGLSIEGFRRIGRTVRRMAEVGDGKAIDMIGSGYRMEILPFAWLALIAGLGDFRVEIGEPALERRKPREDLAYAATRKMIREVKRTLGEYWSSLR